MAAGQHLALRPRLVDGPLEALQRGLVDDGAEVGVAVARVGRLDGPGPLDQPLDEGLGHRALDVDPRGRRALLTGQAERRAGRPLGRDVQVGLAADDHGVLAAHLADHRPRVRAGGLAVELHPDLVGAGERQPVDPGVGHQRAADVVPADHDVERLGRDATVEQAAHDGQRRADALRRRLDHDGVAGRQRRARRPAGERGREVERRDDRPHAVGAQHVGRGLGRVQPAHGLLEAVVVDELVGVVADQVGGLLDVAERLEPVLAHLDRQEGRDHVAPLGDQVGAGLEEADAVPPRRVGPGRGERLGDADGLGDVGGGSLDEPADQDVGVDGRALHDLGARQALVPGDDRAVALAEERLELGQPGVEGCVHLVALGRHRCVGHSECHRLTSLVTWGTSLLQPVAEVALLRVPLRGPRSCRSSVSTTVMAVPEPARTDAATGSGGGSAGTQE